MKLLKIGIKIKIWIIVKKKCKIDGSICKINIREISVLIIFIKTKITRVRTRVIKLTIRIFPKFIIQEPKGVV